ncbi:MAG TPA: hypothetical protein RMH99_32950 [Sandaracinaceae bacterium LLY-WYZ-13_1]|nr:hypothetical protein [Sandaracinaceae bacterium LLY-WYZ-13_1]
MRDAAPSTPMRYARAVGWAAFAGAPILLAALAVAVSRPGAPDSLVGHAAWAAWIAGALAFVASVLADRGGRNAARSVGALSALVVVGFCAFLVWLSMTLAPASGEPASSRGRGALFRVETSFGAEGRGAPTRAPSRIAAWSLGSREMSTR